MTRVGAGLESQVDVEAGSLSGPLLATSHARPGELLELTWTPGPRVHDGHLAARLAPCAGSPVVAWAMGGAVGAVSAMSFVGAWNADAREVAGHPLSCRLLDAEGLEEPFVAWHPSGTFQAVRFDRARGLFVRRVLYPVASGEVVGVLACHVGPG